MSSSVSTSPEFETTLSKASIKNCILPYHIFVKNYTYLGYILSSELQELATSDFQLTGHALVSLIVKGFGKPRKPPEPSRKVSLLPPLEGV